MAAVAKRKIEREPVLNKNLIDSGVALLAFATERGIDSTHQLQMYCIVAQRQLAGEQTTLADFTKLAKMPFSTASRVAWDLVDQKQLMRYEEHPKDRRKKLLVAIIP